MAHFAKLDINNIVVNVSVVDNENILKNGIEDEATGVDYLISLFGLESDYIWKQTSYNGTFRKNYAGIGYTYDPTRDAFISPQPYNSWILNEDTCQWEAPVAYPDDDKRYEWNEDIINWIEITE